MDKIGISLKEKRIVFGGLYWVPLVLETMGPVRDLGIRVCVQEGRSTFKSSQAPKLQIVTGLRSWGLGLGF